MRSYSVADAGVAIQVERKWLDNLLSRHRVDGVDQGGQGIDRRISAEALERLQIVSALTVGLDVPISSALAVAQRLFDSADHRLHIGPGLELHLARASLRNHVEAKVAEAGEALHARPRGRPPSSEAQR